MCYTQFEIRIVRTIDEIENFTISLLVILGLFYLIMAISSWKKNKKIRNSFLKNWICTIIIWLAIVIINFTYGLFHEMKWYCDNGVASDYHEEK